MFLVFLTEERMTLIGKFLNNKNNDRKVEKTKLISSVALYFRLKVGHEDLLLV